MQVDTEKSMLLQERESLHDRIKSMLGVGDDYASQPSRGHSRGHKHTANTFSFKENRDHSGEDAPLTRSGLSPVYPRNSATTTQRSSTI